MPIPQPKTDETQEEFFGRCMADSVMVEEYPDNDIRGGVCSTAWENKSKKGGSNMTTEEIKDFITTAVTESVKGLVDKVEALEKDIKVLKDAAKAKKEDPEPEPEPAPEADKVDEEHPGETDAEKKAVDENDPVIAGLKGKIKELEAIVSKSKGLDEETDPTAEKKVDDNRDGFGRRRKTA